MTDSLLPRADPERHEGISREMRRLAVNGFGAISGRPRTPEDARAEENARLVLAVLRRRFPSLCADPERRAEAYVAGYMGLVAAARRFDPKRECAFSTYAVRCIEGGLLQYLRGERLARRVSCVSLETPIGDEGRELAEMIPDEHAERPGAALVDAAGFEALLEALPPSPAGRRQAELLRALYLDEMTPGEVAEAWGTSRQRVHQLHGQAVQAIREALIRRDAAEAGRKARQEAAAGDARRDARWQRLEALSRTAGGAAGRKLEIFAR